MSDVAEEFGPTDGAQSVRDDAGPRTVSDPGGGISFSTISALATAINANPANSVFVATAASYSGGLSGITDNKHPRIYFPGAPGTRVWDGGGANAIGFNVPVGGMELYGGTLTGWGSMSSTFQGGVIARGPCTIQDVIFDTCYRGIGHGGIAGDGNNGLMTVDHCRFIDNLFAGAVISHNDSMELIFTSNHVVNNNTGAFDEGATASGSKFLHIVDGQFNYNHFDGNLGFGLWFDSCEAPVTAHDNVCENNDRAGIFYEVSDGGSRLHNNACIDNGAGTEPFHHAAQIVVSCSDGSQGVGGGIEVDHNILDGARYSFVLFNHDVHPHDCKEINMHANQMWIRGSLAAFGGTDSQTTKTLWTEASNDFDNNEYHVASLSNSNWHWDSGSGSGVAKTWAQWQAFGFDGSSTREVI